MPDNTDQNDTTTILTAPYRPFFKAGIVVALTLGAVWGAWLLVRIAFSESFTAVGIHEVNAHGHAQIFGWVGLFVMGFAYHMFPRFKNTHLAWPRLALATLGLMLSGILLRSGGQALLSTLPWMRELALVGSVLEVVAIMAFALNIVVTLRGAGKPLAAYDYFILSALFWFIVQAVYGTAYFAALSGAPSRDALLEMVTLWQSPLRDLQIHGFALLMVLGVSHRILEKFYHLPTPSHGRSMTVLVLINLAVVGEAAGFVLMRSMGHSYVAVWYLAVITLFVSILVLVKSWHLFGPAWRPDRSLKFIRAAYVWLIISLAMLVLLPVHQFGLLRLFAPESEAVEIGFSHAYYGAIRHAITVGFISMMILGVASKFVPIMSGKDPRRFSGLWIPFLLLNTGCALRVGFQTLTDFTDRAFLVAGVSGLLEVTALAVWGVHLWSLMATPAAHSAAGNPEALSPAEESATNRVT